MANNKQPGQRSSWLDAAAMRRNASPVQQNAKVQAGRGGVAATSLPEPGSDEMCYPCAHYGHGEGFNPLAEDVNPLQRGHLRHKKGHLSKEDLFEQHRRSD